MKAKNTPFKLKKIPYYLYLLLFTVGASLILGFLSFSGMFAIWPILGLAFASFGLSVIYEGEIYLQNIKGAFLKLFKDDYLKNHLAKEHLLNNFPEDVEDPDYPQFYRDYAHQLHLLEEFTHKTLNAESQQRKKQIEKTLKDMEQWFAKQLFAEDVEDDASDYAKQLRQWLKQCKQDEWQATFHTRKALFHAVKAFSILSSIFMGLGTTYLIVEAFSVIPFFAAIPFAIWPFIIVPMAVIAGIAYGLLTYNAVTDLINNDTIRKWYYKLKDDLSSGVTVRNVVLAISAVLLVGLAVALTICTAGTWWTIANNARPLFEWMSKMPAFIMGIINPIVTGLSAVFFITQNTAESLELVDDATRIEENIFTQLGNFFRESYQRLRETENWGQILNPFRIILKLTVTPLRILLFLGHLISIAVTADRVPGIPQLLAAFIAIISEGFEDLHYFFPNHHEHDHDGHHHHHDTQDLLEERLSSEHGHSHDADIPTRILNGISYVFLYYPIACWDYLFSKLNTQDSEPGTKQPKILSFSEAVDKQFGVKKEHNVEISKKAPRPSTDWQKEHAAALIAKHKQKHLDDVVIGKEVAQEKIHALDELHDLVREAKSSEELNEVLTEAKESSAYNKHRLFAYGDEPTRTAEFIDGLAERVNVGVSAA